MSQQVALEEIQINGGTQPRAEIDDQLVSEYADEMGAGVEFPPVVVFYDGVAYWLADGFHRTHAARRARIEAVSAEVRNGTKRDAVLYSVGANSAHGKRRTNADKRKAVLTLLKDDEWSAWSDREIARQCGVDHVTVGRYRESLVKSTSETQPVRTYTTKHGTEATMGVGNIGRRENDAPKADDSNSSLPATKENHNTKEQRPESRGVGIRIAHEAIAVLKNIPKDDGLRDEGFDIIIDWIETNR